MNYPSERADSLELYVRKTHALSGPAHHLYYALRWLERDRSGLCRPVYAGYRDITAEAGIDTKSVKPALLTLQTEGLIVVTFGRPIKSDKVATEIRRLSLDELKAGRSVGDDDACRLATELSGRAFAFDGKTVKPTWTPGRTGRVCSSRPNIQGTAGSKRIAGLMVGLSRGQVLVHADIRQAEPTIIKHLLHIPVERDLYAEYMAVMACSKPAAKSAINMLAYCKKTLACFAHWPGPAQASLKDYVERLADYKARLFAECRRTRAVTTLTGRTINADKGVRLHPGTVMNWRIQGTVADIINAACLRLLDCTSVIVPLHDAAYAVVPINSAATIEAAIIGKAREIGLPLTVKTEVHHAC